MSAQLKQLLSKARAARDGGEDAWRVQSTSEKLAVAIVLNKPEWIASMNYTLADSVHRVGPDWCAMLAEAQRQIDHERWIANGGDKDGDSDDTAPETEIPR